MDSQTATRVFGGSPVAVLSRLVLLSILVGVVLQTIGLDPMNILQSLETVAREVYAMGFDAVRYVWQYFLLGAMIVVPVWIVLRLLRGGHK
jgi:hypothetical protein